MNGDVTVPMIQNGLKQRFPDAPAVVSIFDKKQGDVAALFSGGDDARQFFLQKGAVKGKTIQVVRIFQSGFLEGCHTFL